ncbi:putative eukaryotic translation initiation factor 2 subunit beta [Trichoderma lentiforme]|uniref:Eukaryotic translation initiation factor 2 subunit beta n=1 Tax=Trichoderma lentiforme TaxID=1567552 RepID=A0A9P4X6Z9_9HYPO|nr:putative eukaryotic translation initiation factor 2 subunit beta [Trichoderma lentiforme]
MDNEVLDQLERKPSRKSVAFTDEQLVVETDGSITIMSAVEEPKETAQSHTPRTPPLSAALEAFADTSSQAAADELAPPEDGGLDLSLLKKKKKKKTKVEGVEADADAEDGAAPAEDGGLDLTMKKKKKKVKKAEGAEEDEFTAKLKQLEVKDAEEAEEAAQEDEGDMETGTGVWTHDESKTIPYTMLLSRFFTVLSQKNPDHSLSGTKSYKIPPPQCMREGNRKTVFANIADISKRMKRTEEHLTAYLFAELGTNGSVDGNRRLVIKGRFQQKQIENVVRKYIIEYVTCKTCRSPDTELNKGENRLYFITCNNCGSRRSVTAIKTGFSAQIGKRKKMQG